MKFQHVLFVAAGLVCVGGSPLASARPQASTAAADLLVVNADVRTVNADLPHASAFAVRDGRFLAIGDEATVRKVAGKAKHVIDAHGQTVVPGLIDGHSHLAGGSDLVAGVDLSYIPDKKTWLKKIKERSDQLPKGEWLVGGGWDYTLSEGVLPTKEDLDAVVPDRPIYLQDIDGHSHWANSLALKMAGITAKTPVDPGSQILLDPKTGEPTGVLLEGAGADLIRKQPGMLKTEARRLNALHQTIAYANSLGLTGIHDMAGRETLFDYFSLAKQGKLNIRVWYGQFSDDPAEIRQAAVDRALIERTMPKLAQTAVKGPTLQFGYIKSIIDGVLSTRTAVLHKDYSDKAGWKGEPFRTQAELEKLISSANAAQFPVSIHAIGDAAVGTVLDAYAAARRPLPAGLHNRIEHIEILDPSDLGRFKTLDVVASMQPNHATGTIGKYITERVGPEREPWAYVWKKFLNTGVPVVFGSDWPTSPLSPLTQINDAVFRESPFGLGNGPWHPENAVSFDEALFAYSQAGANMTPWAQQIGSIEVGKWADFVILDGTLTQPLDRSIRQRSVRATFLAGKPVYEKT